MDRIKPCPFCGFDGGNECLPVKTDEYFTYYAVACADCFARGPRNSRPEKAIEKWNSLLRRDEYERLQEDFDTAARGAAEESVKAARLEREAEWLAENAMRDMCPYEAYDWNKKTDKRPLWCDLHIGPYSECDCSGDTGECWRKAAQDALEAEDEAADAEAERRYGR